MILQVLFLNFGMISLIPKNPAILGIIFYIEVHRYPEVDTLIY